LFDNFAAATQYDKLDGSGDAVFTESSEEILIAIDNSREAFIRPVARDAENGGTFAVQPDDQWNLNRLDKAGFWGNMEEGRVCLDGRAVSGIIV
jgi:hypothetical protein